MTGEQMMEMAKAARANRGLKLEWRLPEGRNFTAYAKDETQKQAWLIEAEAKGWVLV